MVVSANPLSVNNIYGHGYERYDLDCLAQAGFQFRPQISSFVGAQQLRFIDFTTCPCLEFIQVTDHHTYSKFVPPGMTPYAPGINLGLAEGSSKTILEIQEEFFLWEPYLLHENYEGDPEEHQPGWNYLNFTQEIVPDTFIWITDFEEPYPASHPKTSHPNHVVGISGIVFDLEINDLENLAALTGLDFENGVLDLNGLFIYSRESSPLDEGLPKKEFPLSAAILNAESLDYFARGDSNLKETSLRGKLAFYLESPPQSWDIYITSES
jgi:hypothetical protein